MDLIMMEPEDEPFGLVPHENTSRMEENKASSEKDLFDLDRLQQEQKVDVSSEVLTERNANLTRCSHYSNLTIRC
ncbi:uncharacterized protein [Periplaneta americana]|uniref:uncharacterized protein isoform X6 n=1 Tax=Periplaneta americana TaxID=6978 RepID=UPI0037E9C7EA